MNEVGGDMTMACKWMAAAALAATLFGATDVAAASWQDRRKAQKLGREAKALAIKGEFDKAAEKYRQADELIPAPSYKLELARMLVATEDFIEASKVLAGCVEKEPHQWIEKVAYKKCEQFIVEVDERTPTLTVTVFEPSAEKVDIVVGGESYEAGEGAVPFNPGKVEVQAEASGYEPFSKTVKLMEGDRETLEISMTKAASTGDVDDEQEDDGEGISPVWAYTTWALGGVGLGLGIGFGVAAIQTTNDVLREYECDDNNVCPVEAQQDLATAKLNGNISTAGFVVGFAGVTAGTILFLFSSAMDDDEADAVDEEATLGIEAKPMLGPGFVGVTGTF